MKITIAELKKIIEQEIDGLFDDSQETLSGEEENSTADIDTAQDAAANLADDLLKDIADIATDTQLQPDTVLDLVKKNLNDKSEAAG
tara:strand:- start:192 stop:452 length:261 start_codon:yes stop_codon:yes gene_type:complete